METHSMPSTSAFSLRGVCRATFWHIHKMQAGVMDKAMTIIAIGFVPNLLSQEDGSWVAPATVPGEVVVPAGEDPCADVLSCWCAGSVTIAAVEAVGGLVTATAKSACIIRIEIVARMTLHPFHAVKILIVPQSQRAAATLQPSVW
mmetsp:Transcript_6760/g.11887  ORF Transcript_6760/g.11887 Transcript_6760/m.11887 type:complete len:146 (-) Transcript_6760:51-488(-)